MDDEIDSRPIVMDIGSTGFNMLSVGKILH